jgi:hypothetical protein
MAGVNVHKKNPQPLMPINIGIFLKSRKGSKDMYNVLNRNTVQISAEQKLHQPFFNRKSYTIKLQEHWS